jgi:hypothetical protein
MTRLGGEHLGTDPWMLALDSNAFTYWIQAEMVRQTSHRSRMPMKKLALVRIFFWIPTEACFKIVPTVRAEYGAIRNGAKT